MVDVHNPETRSYNMSRIRSRNTRPEMVVRSLVHRMGFRFALHKKSLPGKPDIVFVSRHKIINVHGCFFHMHKCRFGRVTPNTNTEFWKEKRLRNLERDRSNNDALISMGWSILTIWECETKDPVYLTERINKFLNV